MSTVHRRGRRERVPGEIATARIWAWITPRERALLAEVAAESGQTIAVIIREAVNSYVSDFRDDEVFADTGRSQPPPH